MIFGLLKPAATLLLFRIIFQSTNFGGARLSKNRRKLKVKRHLQYLPEGVWAKRVSAGAASGKLIWYWAVKFFEDGLSRQLVPSDSEGNNCASEATQILRLNNEQNLRYLNILAYKK